MEQHSLNPILVTFHNVISDSEIDALKEMAQPLVIPLFVKGLQSNVKYVFFQFNRSLIGRSGESDGTRVRSSKSAWLKNTSDAMLERISNRIKLITGLEMNPTKGEADFLQVLRIYLKFCKSSMYIC